MQEKFKIEKIANNIYKIQEAWFKEHANLYLLKGKNFDLLIDCGLGIFNLKNFLAEKGFNNVKVLLTHSHFDHAFGIKHFPPQDILLTPKIYEKLKDKKMWGLGFLNLEDLDGKVLSKKGIKRKEDICKDFKVFVSGLEPADFDFANNGYFSLKFLSVPGHTDDSTSYYDAKRGILITGDTLYDGEAYFGFPDSDKKNFIKSLDKISRLDFKIALPGHNRAITKAKSLEVILKWKNSLLYPVD